MRVYIIVLTEMEIFFLCRAVNYRRTRYRISPEYDFRVLLYSFFFDVGLSEKKKKQSEKYNKTIWKNRFRLIKYA